MAFNITGRSWRQGTPQKFILVCFWRIDDKNFPEVCAGNRTGWTYSEELAAYSWPSELHTSDWEGKIKIIIPACLVQSYFGKWRQNVHSDEGRSVSHTPFRVSLLPLISLARKWRGVICSTDLWRQVPMRSKKNTRPKRTSLKLISGMPSAVIDRSSMVQYHRHQTELYNWQKAKGCKDLC